MSTLTEPRRPWLDRLVEPSFALRGAALAMSLLELRAALAALTGNTAEPYDGLIVQLWRRLGGGAMDVTPLLLTLGMPAHQYPMLLHLEQPTLAEVSVLCGFAVLVVRTRVKEG